MAAVVIYDACVLHPAPLRDLLIRLPDPDDRHVLAAAIRAGAETIVTANLADFPRDSLACHQVEAKHPDDFVVELIDSAPEVVLAVLARQAGDLRKPPRRVDELLDLLQSIGLPAAVARLRELQRRDL